MPRLSRLIAIALALYCAPAVLVLAQKPVAGFIDPMPSAKLTFFQKLTHAGKHLIAGRLRRQREITPTLIQPHIAVVGQVHGRFGFALAHWGFDHNEARRAELCSEFDGRRLQIAWRVLAEFGKQYSKSA